MATLYQNDFRVADSTTGRVLMLVPASNALFMVGKTITNSGDPTGPTDLATTDYVTQNLFAHPRGDLNMGGQDLKGLPTTPSSEKELVSSAYVTSRFNEEQAKRRDFGGRTLSSVGIPLNDTDLATAGYVRSKLATATFDNAGGARITDVGRPYLASDMATAQYVNDKTEFFDPLDMHSHKIVKVSNGTLKDQLVTKAQVDGLAAYFAPLTRNVDMKGFPVRGVPDLPATSPDATSLVNLKSFQAIVANAPKLLASRHAPGEIKNVGAPTAPTSMATKAYTVSKLAAFDYHDHGLHRIVRVGNTVNPKDMASKKYVEDTFLRVSLSLSSTASNMGGMKVSNVQAGTAASDMVTKAQVDEAFSTGFQFHDMGGRPVVNVADAVDANDMVNKETLMTMSYQSLFGDMKNQRLRNLGAPLAASHAVTKKALLDGISALMTADMRGLTVTNLADGTKDEDAVTKSQADAAIADLHGRFDAKGLTVKVTATNGLLSKGAADVIPPDNTDVHSAKYLLSMAVWNVIGYADIYFGYQASAGIVTPDPIAVSRGYVKSATSTGNVPAPIFVKSSTAYFSTEANLEDNESFVFPLTTQSGASAVSTASLLVWSGTIGMNATGMVKIAEIAAEYSPVGIKGEQYERKVLLFYDGTSRSLSVTFITITHGDSVTKQFYTAQPLPSKINGKSLIVAFDMNDPSNQILACENVSIGKFVVKLVPPAAVIPTLQKHNATLYGSATGLSHAFCSLSDSVGNWIFGYLKSLS